MKRYHHTITLDGATVAQSTKPVISVNDLRSLVRTLIANQPQHKPLVEGEVAETKFTLVMECACTENHRAQPRPKDVIAAERAAQLAASLAWTQKWEEQQKKRDEETAKRLQLKRQRITHQIDYAFKTGHEVGSEPVAKYITCHCDAPADFIYVNVPLAPGAAVLDETTITEAVCDRHNYAAKNPMYHQGAPVEIIPCSRLEFFYTGIRTISIKDKQ